MNVLIVMPKIVERTDEWYMFPLGTAYVSAALKRANICNVFTCNLNCYDDINEKLRELILGNNIDIIATGGLTVQYNVIQQVISTAKKIKKDIITLLGGGIVTSSPELIMDIMPEIDYGMIGEGEFTICELVKALIQKTDISQVKGIVYRKDQSVIRTQNRRVIEDLNQIPFPDYDGFEFESTLRFSPVNVGIYTDRVAYILTSRGCPFNCTFCFHPQGDGYRMRDLDNVFMELDWLIEKYQIKSVMILDELFGGNNVRLKEFCERIAKYNIKWWVETRVQFATEENLELMKSSGCVQVLLGIENVNQSILDSMKKKITVEEVESALSNAFKVGISATGVIIFGDLAETEETVMKSMNWWKHNPQYNIMLTTLQVYPGSGVWDYAVNSGILGSREAQMDHIINGCPKINLTGLSNTYYSEMCKKIGQLNCSKSIDIVDAVIFEENWNKDRLYANVSGKCNHCSAFNVWENVNILGEGGSVEPFICKNCGQAHSNPFQMIYLKYGVENIKSMLMNKVNIALWGQSRKLVAMCDRYWPIVDDKLFYVDNSPAKWGGNFFGVEIHSPKELLENNIDVIIVAVGDNKIGSVRNTITEMYRNRKDKGCPKILSIGELMNPHFEFL